MDIAESDNADAGVQANLPEPDVEDTSLKIRGLERVALYPKVPPEPSAYGKGKSYSRPWILQDGRPAPEKGSEMKLSYVTPKKAPRTIGIRKQMLKNFFWDQMMEEAIEELSTATPVTEYCTEYESNYVKDNFEPRNLEIPLDKDLHIKYPLYGTGTSAITFYSETIKRTGPGEILEKFRRCQYFTKPMEERLDNGWVL